MNTGTGEHRDLGRRIGSDTSELHPKGVLDDRTKRHPAPAGLVSGLGEQVIIDRDGVVRFAYVGESVLDPAKYYRNNVMGSLCLLEAMRASGVDKLVFSSTCAIYGTPERLPLTEDHDHHPVSPYGASKSMVEQMLADFDSAHGLRSISLRYFNAAGADDEGRIGE